MRRAPNPRRRSSRRNCGVKRGSDSGKTPERRGLAARPVGDSQQEVEVFAREPVARESELDFSALEHVGDRPTSYDKTGLYLGCDLICPSFSAVFVTLRPDLSAELHPVRRLPPGCGLGQPGIEAPFQNATNDLR